MKILKKLDDDVKYKIENAINSEILEKFSFKVINYLDLNKFNQIEDVCGTTGVILYTPISEKMRGHYSTLWMSDDFTKLNYWCSYGYNLSSTISKSDYMLSTPIKDEEFLTNLVRDFIKRGGLFIVNHEKYQSLNKDVSTCGRYSMIRLMKKDLSHDEFKSWFKLKKQPNISNDELITLLTFLVD